MLRKISISKGSVYILTYVVISAASHVFINHTTRSVAPTVSLFYTSLFTIVFFSILNLKELAYNITLIKENKQSILWLNLLNTIIWFVFFYCLKILSPAVFSCLFLGAIPINIFILELKKSKNSTNNNLITGLLLVIMFISMLLLVFQDIDKTNATQILKYGSIVLIIGGIVAAFIMKISEKLAVKKLSASLVVSLRFYGLLIVSFVVILSNPKQLLISPTVLLEFLLLALASMALPLFLLQKALKTLTPLFTSVIITAIPILTYFFQLATGYYSFSFIKLGFTLLFSLSLITLTYSKNR